MKVKKEIKYKLFSFIILLILLISLISFFVLTGKVVSVNENREEKNSFSGFFSNVFFNKNREDNITLSFGDFNQETGVLQIIIDNPTEYDLWGMQTDIDDENDTLIITGAYGGLAEQYFNAIPSSPNMVLFWGIGSYIPAGEDGLLMNVVTSEYSGGDICFDGLVLSGPPGVGSLDVQTNCWTNSFSCEDYDFLLGDVTVDNSLDILDIVTIMNYVVEGSIFNDLQLCAADYNEDGVIDVLDVVALVNYLVTQGERVEAISDSLNEAGYNISSEIIGNSKALRVSLENQMK